MHSLLDSSVSGDQVDSHYCPSCLENMPSAEAKLKKNRYVYIHSCRSLSGFLTSSHLHPFIHSWLSVLYCRCANCFDCPCCMHTLSTRATNIPAPLPDDPTKTAMKKAYYLACGFCRWTSRDVGMADKSVGECWWNDTLTWSYLQYFQNFNDVSKSCCRSVVVLWFSSWRKGCICFLWLSKD